MSALRELVGDCPAIVSLRDKLRDFLRRQSAAGRQPSILIQGETGSGKGLLAAALHRAGPRKDKPFVEVNCAAIPENLVEAELFGFERGAFTDARHAKPGLFQTAHGGTLFLDEVGLLPLALQGKLLNVLETGSVRRLGATRGEPVNVSVIAASNEDLPAAVRAKQFREDLYHRLAVVTFHLPPLRERDADVELLAEQMLDHFCGAYGLPTKSLDKSGRAALRAYRWPGNVRELRNVIERAVLFAESPDITAETLQLPVPDPSRAERGSRDELVDALTRTGGNISRTAALLGLTRNTVRARMKHFGLSAPEGPRRPAAPPRGAVPSVTGDPPGVSAPPVAAERLAVYEAVDRSRPELRPDATASPALRWDRRLIAFVRVVLGEDETACEVSRALEVVIDKFQNFGGQIESLTSREAEVAFGVYPMEEASRRAAYAALAVRRELLATPAASADTPSRMAIHTCEVPIGHAGGVPRIDSDARASVDPLMDSLIAGAEPGAIVASPATAAHLRRHFVLDPPWPGQPGVARYRVVSHEQFAAGVPGRAAPFVGRQREMTVLEDGLEEAVAGRGQVIAILGHPGVGKSRLVWEFMRSPRAKTVRQLETGSAYASITPYLSVISLVRRYFGVGFHDSPERIRERVTAAVAAGGGSLEPLVPALLALMGVRDGRWEALDPIERRHHTREAVKRLLLHESGVEPLLVVFEDVQWIDSESQALLDALVEGLPTARLLLLVTYRPEYRHGWTNLSYYTQLHIGPLPPSSAAILLDGMLGADSSLDPLKRHLLQRADRNPLFLEEIVQALIETGALKGERGAYQAIGPAGSELPDTVEAILATRIDRLGPGEQALVQSASAIGAEVPMALLATVMGLPEETMRSRMRPLQAAELLYESRTTTGSGFVFKHALTREVAYRSLGAERRRDLHRRVLTAMETGGPDRSPDAVDQLAWHAYEAELWDKAAAYMRRAGDRAMGAAAAQEAAEYFTRARQALERLPPSQQVREQLVDVRLRTGDALWTLLQLDRLLENLRQAESIAGDLRDERRRGWTAAYLCLYFWAVGDLAQARPAGDLAVAIGRSTNNPALTAEAGLYRGVVAKAEGQFRAAADALRATLRDFEHVITVGNPEFPSKRFALNGPVIVRSFLCRALSQLGEFREAIAVGEHALHLARASNSPFALVAASGGLGTVYVRKGEPAKAVPIMEPVMHLCRQHRLDHWIPTLAGALGLAQVQMGVVDEGLALLEESVSHGERLGLAASSAVWKMNLGEAYLLVGRLKEARAVAARALTLCHDRGERGYEARALLLLADVEAQDATPDHEQVMARYEEAAALGRACGMRPLLACCHRGLGRFHRRAGRLKEAEAEQALAAAAFAELEIPCPAE